MARTPQAILKATQAEVTALRRLLCEYTGTRRVGEAIEIIKERVADAAAKAAAKSKKPKSKVKPKTTSNIPKP